MNYYNKLITERNKLIDTKLEFGCLFLHKDKLFTFVANTSEDKIGRENFLCVEVSENPITTYRTQTILKASEVEILGQPLSLQDILRMLPEYRGFDLEGDILLTRVYKSVNCEEIINGISSRKWKELEIKHKIRIDLTKPLSEQEEVCEQIYKLINNND